MAGRMQVEEKVEQSSRSSPAAIPPRERPIVEESVPTLFSNPAAAAAARGISACREAQVEEARSGE